MKETDAMSVAIGMYNDGYNKAIDEVLPLIEDIRGLCRDDVLKDLIEKVEQLKEQNK